MTSSEESVEATQPESQAQENESNEAETNAQNQQVTTAAAGPTIPQQTYRYQLTINNLTMIIIGVIFAIAIVVAILAVTLIRRRNKDDDDVYEQEAGNDEEKEIVPTPISAQEKVQRAQKTAKAHVKQSAKEQEILTWFTSLHLLPRSVSLVPVLLQLLHLMPTLQISESRCVFRRSATTN